MTRYLFLSLLFFIISIFTRAQYYSSGSDPASIKWRRIDTGHFRIVFPGEFEKDARRLAAIFEKIYHYGGYTLGHDPKKIDVLIHSRSAYSNGFVSWAPKRIELYPTPDQDIFSQDYLEQLALHEFRHVVQIDKLNTGFTKALSVILGQQAVGGVLGIYIPMWFLEGDAVLTETLLSHSGRGRLPSFEQELKAQLVEKGIYKYDKAYLGSYRDYVPNYYIMGYHLVAGARSKYGKDVWERALENTGKRSWSITPFNHGIKKVTGLNKTTLYKNIFNDWKNLWLKEDSVTSFTAFSYITKRDPKYKDYFYPKYLNDSIIVAQVAGPGEVTRYVTIDTKSGKEKNLFTPGYHEQAPFSLACGKLVWAETEPDVRWENADRSNIWIYDTDKKKAKRLTRGTRYFAPALSPDGKSIAVVHISDKGESCILFLDPESGTVTDTLNTPGNRFPLTPVWTPDGKKLVTIILTGDMKQIFYFDLTEKKWHAVTAATYANIRQPFATNDEIYFSGSWTETENIYRVNIHSKKTEQITSSRFGGTSAALNKKESRLILSDYSSDGYRIASVKTDSVKTYETDILPRAPQYPLLKKPLKEEMGVPDLLPLTGDTLNTDKYSGWHLFNFHSWAPAYINFNDPMVKCGASLLSQNLLGNSFLTLGYNADKQYTREKFYFNYIYTGIYPKFNLEINSGNDDIYYTSSTPEDTFVVESVKKEQFMNINLEISFPFNITRGAWSRLIQPSFETGYQKAFDYDAKKSYITYIDGEWQYTGVTENFRASGYNLYSLNYELFFYNIRKRSQRDVTTRWGQVVELTYRHSPFGSVNFGSLTGLSSTLYFPGLLKYHSIRIINNWQKKRRGDYAGNDSGGYRIDYGFSDYITFARGYDSKYNDELYTLRNDYIFPVWNPDINLASLMYFKRLILNLFYDYSRSSYKLQNDDTKDWLYVKNNYQSTGFEARVQVHLLRFIFPFQVGYRYSYLINEKKSSSQFLFSINFSGYSVN